MARWGGQGDWWDGSSVVAADDGKTPILDWVWHLDDKSGAPALNMS